VKPRTTFLKTLWRKLRGRPSQHAPEPVRLRAEQKSGPAPLPPRTIEPLERRIAPASLVNPSTLMFTDIDGDTVTIEFSRPLFDLPASTLNTKLDDVFKFSAGDAHSGTETPQQLQLIDLTKAPVVDFNNAAAGISFTISATKTGQTGDGLADIGAIKASGLSLGAVTIDGDLGQIDCGSPTSKTALRVLDVQSFHTKGLTTQQPVTSTGTAGDAEKAEKLESRITGALGEFFVANDMQGYLHVVNGTQIVNGQSKVTAPGKIKTVDIDGSLIGVAAAGAQSDNTGRIDSIGSINKISIGSTANDGIVGGGGANSGAITGGQSIKSISISGGILGGGGAKSGRISATEQIQKLSVATDIIGGDGANSGVVHSAGKLNNVIIGEDLVAGKGAASGVVAADGLFGQITVRGDINGNITDAGARSGGISGAKEIGKVSVDGAINGGSGVLTGYIESNLEIGAVTINGDVVGGAGTGSGSIASGGKLGTVVVNGKLMGGAGDESGSIRSGLDSALSGAISSIKVAHGLEGGAGHSSGSIVAGSFVREAMIGVNEAAQVVIKGGAGNFSGSIFGNDGLGKVTVLGAIAGDAGIHSGAIESFGPVKSVAVRGGEVRGGAGDFSGAIIVHDHLLESGDRAGDLGSITIANAILGGTGAHSGGVNVDGALNRATIGSMTNSEVLVGLGFVGSGGAGQLSVTGNITDSAVRVNEALGSFSAGNVIDSTLSAVDELRTIRVTGNVAGSQILAGYDVNGGAVNGDAQIGKVSIGGNWTASDLVAGIEDVGANGFGNDDDALIGTANDPAIIARIASVIINGTVSGSEAADDHFGFVAEQIVAFKHGGQALALSKTGIDVKELDATHQDLSLREVAAQI
jgi:hypothetical protein